KTVPSAHPNGRSELNDVAAIAPADAWAVGDVQSSEPLIEHWDGRRWSRMAVPGIHGNLAGVSAASARDVWAVGGAASAAVFWAGGGETGVLRWDGTRWRRWSSPGGDLRDVVALSTRDVWVVGNIGDYPSQPFAARWDGRGWHRFVLSQGPTDPDGHWSFLTATAVSADDVWAAGGYQYGNTIRDPILYRWNGRRWQEKPSPSLGQLFAIAARSPRDLWTVAY